MASLDAVFKVLFESYSPSTMLSKHVLLKDEDI